MRSFLSPGFWRGGGGGDEGLREHAADMSQKGGIIVAKIKFALGPVPTPVRFSHACFRENTVTE